jgi:hypothetical protein
MGEIGKVPGDRAQVNQSREMVSKTHKSLGELTKLTIKALKDAGSSKAGKPLKKDTVTDLTNKLESDLSALNEAKAGEKSKPGNNLLKTVDKALDAIPEKLKQSAEAQKEAFQAQREETAAKITELQASFGQAPEEVDKMDEASTLAMFDEIERTFEKSIQDVMPESADAEAMPANKPEIPILPLHQLNIEESVSEIDGLIEGSKGDEKTALTPRENLSPRDAKQWVKNHPAVDEKTNGTSGWRINAAQPKPDAEPKREIIRGRNVSAAEIGDTRDQLTEAISNAPEGSNEKKTLEGALEKQDMFHYKTRGYAGLPGESKLDSKQLEANRIQALQGTKPAPPAA